MIITAQYEVKKNNIFINYLNQIIFFSLAFGVSYVFFLYLTRHNFGDFPAHFSAVNDFVNGHWRLPHIGFEYTTYYLAKLLHLSFITSGILVLTFFFTLSLYIVFWLLRHFLEISTFLALLITIGLFLVSAIYLPFFSHNMYLGQGSPNIWHNPTFLIVTPFAFLLTYLTIQSLEHKEKNEWLLISALLLLSMVYKPIFWLVYIPALFIYIALAYTKDIKAYLTAALVVLPSCILAVYQFHLMQISFDKQPNGESAVLIMLFGVLHLYTPNVLVSLLQGIAFPLSVALFRFKAVFTNKYLQFIWIMLAIAWAQMAFLAERGKHFGDANFFWGYAIVLHILFVFSFIEYFKWITEKNRKTFLITTERVIVSLLLFAHLFSGIIYMYRILTTLSFV